MTSATSRSTQTEEFRSNWKALLACLLGLGSGLSVNSFIMSTLAPYLMKEFGWSRAQWATTGMVTLAVILAIPIVGRLTDRYGVRKIVTIGIIAYPCSLVAMTFMDGTIEVFWAIYFLQALLGCTTTATVYTRLVAGSFESARGIALALCGASPAIVGAISGPLITAISRQAGWREAMWSVAAFSLVCGLMTLLLMPSGQLEKAANTRSTAPSPAGVGALLRRPTLWTLILATFLVSLPLALVNTQLKVVVLAQGLSDAAGGMMISIFAIGVTVGRLLSGLALDRFAPHSVAALFLGFPAIGMLLLAVGPDTVVWIGLAIFAMGLAFGGEGDVIAYIVVQTFGISAYSAILGLLTAIMGLASASGSALLSRSLAASNSFTPYLIVASVAVLVGSLLFFCLGLLEGRQRQRATGPVQS